eukprot:1007311_1
MGMPNIGLPPIEPMRWERIESCPADLSRAVSRGGTVDRTRSKLMKEIRKIEDPDTSFDIDGDGVVSQRDYFLGKFFDRDRDGKLNAEEARNAHEAIKEGGVAHDNYARFFSCNVAKRGIPLTRFDKILCTTSTTVPLTFEDSFNRTIGDFDSRNSIAAPSPTFNEIPTRRRLLQRRRNELKSLVRDRTNRHFGSIDEMSQRRSADLRARWTAPVPRKKVAT